MPTIDQIRESIEARLVELTAEINALNAAKATLHAGAPERTAAAASSTAANGSDAGGHAADGRAGAATRPDRAPEPVAAIEPAGADVSAAPSRSTTVKRKRERLRPERRGAGATFDVLPAGKLEALLQDAPAGLTAAAIAKQSGASRAQVLDLLRDWEREGKARREGARGTVWRLISDEERIAARAAELERLSARHAAR